MRETMADPILPTEIRPTLDRLLVGPLLLAVSGGTDSLTLMALVADWRAAQADGSPPSVLVATVDHGLRPASASEAPA